MCKLKNGRQLKKGGVNTLLSLKYNDLVYIENGNARQLFNVIR